MRPTFAAFALLLCLPVLAQEPYVKVEIVELDTATTADEMRARARRWFVDTFKDAKEVIQMDDPNTNTIVGKGSFQYRPTILNSSEGRIYPVQFSIEIQCKKGRYRVRLYDFVQPGGGALGPILADSLHCSGSIYYRTTNGTPTKFHEKLCAKEVWPQIHGTEAQLLSSLKATMQSKPSGTDW